MCTLLLSRDQALHFEAIIAATTIRIPPAISCIEETSPSSTKVHAAANTDSMHSMTLDSLADVSLCPSCYSRSATAPGPTAL